MNPQKGKSTKPSSGGPASNQQKSISKKVNPFSPLAPAGKSTEIPSSTPGHLGNSENVRSVNPNKGATATASMATVTNESFSDNDSDKSNLDSFFKRSSKRFEDMLQQVVDRFVSKIADIESLFGASLEFERERVNDLLANQKRLESKVKFLEEEVSKLRDDAVKNDVAANKSERFSRRNNVRFVGIDEATARPDDVAMANDDDAGGTPDQPQSEKCIPIVEDILQRHFGISSKVERAHRDDRVVPGKPRHILVKFLSYRDKVEVMRKARDALKKEKFFVVDDLTVADLSEKRKWSKNVQALYNQGIRMRFYAGKWRLRGGNVYNFETPVNGASLTVSNDE